MGIGNRQQPAIVFDLGAVLVDWNPRYLYRKLFTDTQEMEYFLREICSQEWNVQQDAGRSFADAIALLVNDFPEYEDKIAAYFDRWSEMIGGEIDGTAEVLAELYNSGFELHALTNWSAETFPIATNRFSFFEYFNEIVVSGVEKCVKPDAEIYNILLDRINRSAGDCIFIDDNLPNIEAAKSLGFIAIHFVSAQQLRIQLAQCHESLTVLNN